jgi:RNA polymerase sigma-70 factor (ECF subfamily)
MDVPLELPREATTIEDVYREQLPRLWRSLLAYTGDRDIAQDAIAEAFAQALRRGTAVRQPDRWVWRAAFRIASGSLKSRRRFTEAGGEPAYELDDVPVVLAEALGRLSDGQRAAVILHYYADLPIRDVAAAMGTTGGAVKVSLMRARRRLRILLESHDG